MSGCNLCPHSPNPYHSPLNISAQQTLLGVPIKQHRTTPCSTPSFEAYSRRINRDRNESCTGSNQTDKKESPTPPPSLTHTQSNNLLTHQLCSIHVCSCTQKPISGLKRRGMGEGCSY